MLFSLRDLMYSISTATINLYFILWKKNQNLHQNKIDSVMVKVRYSVARITTLQTLGPGFTVWKDNANHHCKPTVGLTNPYWLWANLDIELFLFPKILIIFHSLIRKQNYSVFKARKTTLMFSKHAAVVSPMVKQKQNLWDSFQESVKEPIGAEHELHVLIFTRTRKSWPKVSKHMPKWLKALKMLLLKYLGIFY